MGLLMKLRLLSWFGVKESSKQIQIKQFFFKYRLKSSHTFFLMCKFLVNYHRSLYDLNKLILLL